MAGYSKFYSYVFMEVVSTSNGIDIFQGAFVNGGFGWQKIVSCSIMQLDPFVVSPENPPNDFN